ncbi:MAG: polyhydroxyalkanoic acid system family protein [Acidobacteriota bacterium]
MSELNLKFPTGRQSMDEIRPALDAALKATFPGGMMKSRWEGDVLHLSGPGAEGSIVLEGGELVGRATLKPPASMMKTVIEEKMSKVMQASAG